jgi:hypothetical protein
MLSAMRWMLLALLGCGSASEAPVPVEEPADEPVAVEEDAPPAGRIGGEPILPDPVVLGAISADAVETVVATHMDRINTCWETERAKDPKLAGKVLVKLVIGPDGSVTSTATKSTSLRNEPTETCVNQDLASATFPPLQGGKIAIVTYPFVFPPL